jgi:hypothetical protein
LRKGAVEDAAETGGGSDSRDEGGHQKKHVAASHRSLLRHWRTTRSGAASANTAKIVALRISVSHRE